MTVPRRPSVTPAASKRLEKLSDQLSDQLDTAKIASEATTKEVQHARQTARHVRHDLRLQRHPDDTKDGKSQAAVELGRKGGAARAKKLTGHQRSAVARKAAKTRWSRSY
jgi:hypothetical protein